MENEAKIYKDAMYSYKNLAYTRQEALRNIATLMLDPNESPEEKVSKAIEILTYSGSMPYEGKEGG